jgi:hypothetical protein
VIGNVGDGSDKIENSETLGFAEKDRGLRFKKETKEEFKDWI